MSLEVHSLKALSDNYIYVVRDKDSEQTLVVDPSEAKPVIEFLQARGWGLDRILNTHHHWDHVGGNLELKQRFSCTVTCSTYDFKRIEGADIGVNEGDLVNFGAQQFQVIEIPGHTLGHLAFYNQHAGIAFVGDTLFSLGCGRLFEGTPEQMFESLQKLMHLPGDTRIYCGHEYTLANAKFAVEIDAGNLELKKYIKSAEEKIRTGLPTVPAMLSTQLRANPFLRSDQIEIAKYFGLDCTPGVETFRRLRKLKDSF